jgi:hypothetical protein
MARYRHQSIEYIIKAYNDSIIKKRFKDSRSFKERKQRQRQRQRVRQRSPEFQTLKTGNLSIDISCTGER